MAGIRVGLGVLVASMVLAPASAWACEEHDPEERERVSGLAGESVSLDIPNTLEGAEWSIGIEDGDELAKGQDESADEGTEAEFDVPDLGEDEGEVDLVVAVTHEADGADWSYEVELEYGGRPAPEPPKQAEPEPGPPPAPEEQPPPPQPAPERSTDTAPAPASTGTPPPPPPPAPATPAQRSVPATPPASPVGTALLPGGKTPPPVLDLPDGTRAVVSGAPAPVSEAASPRPGTDSRSPSRSRRRTRRPEPQALPGTPARPRPHVAAGEGGIRLPEVELPGFGSGLAWSLIAGGGLAFAVAGLGVAGLGRHRRRRGALLGP